MVILPADASTFGRTRFMSEWANALGAGPELRPQEGGNAINALAHDVILLPTLMIHDALAQHPGLKRRG